MKRFLTSLAIILLIINFISCSEEPPSFRVKNERATKANVQIKTVNNTVNINDVQPGTITGFQDVAEGRVEIKAEIQDETNEPEGSFIASNDRNYTIIIQNTTPPSIKIDIEDK